MEFLLHNLSMIVSGDQFDQMKKADAMLCHVFVDILRKVALEMVVTHLDFSSFSMTISNPIHLVIVFVIEVDMGMNDDTAVEVVVKDYKMLMNKVVLKYLILVTG